MDDILEQYKLAIKNIRSLDRNDILGSYKLNIYVWDELIASTLTNNKGGLSKGLSGSKVDLLVNASEWLFKKIKENKNDR